LWIAFASFYEEGGSLDDARTIFEKATKVNYKNVNDLATLWCEYAEMELRHNNYQRALDIMARATTPPRNPNVNFRDEVCFIKFIKHDKSFTNPFFFFS